MSTVKLTRSDLRLVAELELAGGCSLDRSPGKNWVENAGGLPDYICRIARAIKRSGKSTGAAIAIAVSRVKKWSADPRVDADTRAKSAAAVAEWEAKKAKSHVKMSARTSDTLLALTSSFRLNDVYTAWENRNHEARKQYLVEHVTTDEEEALRALPDMPIDEVWSDAIIVSDREGQQFRVPFVVENGQFVFDTPTPVRSEYVLDEEVDFVFDDGGLTDSDLERLMALTAVSEFGEVSCREAMARVLRLTQS